MGTPLAGLLLSLGVATVAALLSVWLVVERGSRPADLLEDDRIHFRRQDLRRIFVAASMLVLALLIAVGTRVGPGAPGQPNLVFVQIWTAVFALLVLLFFLALVDWHATQRYASRQRARITREGLAIIREALREHPPAPESPKAE